MKYIIPCKTTEMILNSVKFGDCGLGSSNNTMAEIYNLLFVKIKHSIRNSVLFKVDNCVQKTE